MTVPDIFLEEWAANRHVELRTAQGWAKSGKIPAKLKKARVLVERTIRKYVIPENATLPE